MKKLLSFSVIALGSLTFFTACNDYGKKITVEGTKGEIYYKDGATEADAQKVGSFLKQDGFLGSTQAASVQVDRIGDNYTVRFVYNKNYYEKTPGIEDFFRNYTARMSKELFNGKRVDITLTDKYFKDFKNIPYDESAGNTPDGTFNKAAYHHRTVGDVNFYWKDITDEESKPIVDYIYQNGAFSGGTAELYISKENNRYLVQFPVKPEYRNDAGTIAQVQKVSKEIKDNVFPSDPFTFTITDEQLNSVKAFDY